MGSRRFIVLFDEGDYANAASGTICDADLDALLVTDGARWVDSEDSFTIGYWGLLLDKLEDIRTHMEDPDNALEEE
jgi:hypothetical protein